GGQYTRGGPHHDLSPPACKQVRLHPAGPAPFPYTTLFRSVAVRAFSQLGWPLRVVGAGVEQARLEAMAGPSVRFYGHLDPGANRSEEHTSELQSLAYIVFRLLLENKKG